MYTKFVRHSKGNNPKKAIEASHHMMAHFELTPEIERLKAYLMPKPRVLMLAWNLSSETSTFKFDPIVN